MSTKESASEVVGSDTSLSVSGLTESVDISGISGLVDDTTNLSSEDLLSSNDTTGLKKLKMKGVVEKKQMLHDLQLLRIQLSQKSLLIDNLKAQHLSKVEELEEKLYDALHKKQMLQAKLDNTKVIQQDDSRKRQEQTQKELKIILERQRELEQTNKELQVKSLNIRTQLEGDCQITEKQYIDLKSQHIDDMTIAEYFSLRLYEAMQSTKIERDNLRSQREKLSTDIAHLSHSLHTCKQKLLEEERLRSNFEIQLKAALGDLETTRNKIHESSGKIQRFDSILKERNRLESELADLNKKHSYLQAESINLQKQVEELKTEKNQFLQTEQILKQDKDYLARNLSECAVKLENCQDTLRRTQDQLERTKQAREELYEKYAASRDEARLSYERRLQTELDRIRIQTDGELEKLRSDAKESYERENRSLREARDLAVQERNQLYKLKEDAEKRCEIFGGEMRALEASIDARISDFQNEARIKTFELDRLQLIHEETCKNLERLQNQNEKTSRKLELVTTDYGELQRKTTETESELRASVKNLRSRLDTYEGIEKELDDIVMQAAEVEVNDKDPSEAERVLFSYGFGANIPTSAKHRMKQSVHLARRVLQLEKINSSLHADIQRRDEEMKEICSKLKNSNKLLDETRQPYSYLIDSMRKRDGELEQQRNMVLRLEEQVGDLKSDNKELRETKQLLLTDLDRLLSHREELSVMKRVVSNMSSSARQEYDRNFLDSLDCRRYSTPNPVRESPRTDRKKCVLEELTSSPRPLIFTNHKEHRSCTKPNPERCRRMRDLVNR